MDGARFSPDSRSKYVEYCSMEVVKVTREKIYQYVLYVFMFLFAARMHFPSTIFLREAFVCAQE